MGIFEIVSQFYKSEASMSLHSSLSCAFFIIYYSKLVLLSMFFKSKNLSKLSNLKPQVPPFGLCPFK